jgi:pimeloyl-ACP methyl ester carboxylesterase
MRGDCRGLLGASTLFVVGRRPGLQRGCGLADMASDYAATIEVVFGGPVDFLGTSTGGSIALRFAADHPHLRRRLVVRSAACRLGSAGRAVQRLAAEHARRRERREVARLMMGWVAPGRSVGRWLFEPVRWLGALSLTIMAPRDALDCVVAVEAADAFDRTDRLGEIAARRRRRVSRSGAAASVRRLQAGHVAAVACRQ